jgi:hypothetical protein
MKNMIKNFYANFTLLMLGTKGSRDGDHGLPWLYLAKSMLLKMAQATAPPIKFIFFFLSILYLFQVMVLYYQIM